MGLFFPPDQELFFPIQSQRPEAVTTFSPTPHGRLILVGVKLRNWLKVT